MKQKVSLGVVNLARTTFDFIEAEKMYSSIKKDLKVIENVDFYFVDKLVIEVEEAKVAAKFLLEKSLDGLIVISGTFHLGHLILEINKVLNIPILLWGLNELPYDGGKIRLNSVCGLNLNASNLYKAGIKNFYYSISDAVDENWIDAIRIIKAFKIAHIGLAGFRAHGFFNVAIDELRTYEETGILIDHYELSDIFNEEVEDRAVKTYFNKIKNTFDLSNVKEGQVEKVALLCGKIKAFFERNNLTALAIRCWPEFAATFGIAPCAAMSILQSEGVILGCEGDVEGTISMVAHKAIGGETPFLADLSQIDIKEDFALMWHCGVAPSNLWDGHSERSLDTYFAGGKGVTADFVMKEGKVSILRLDSANGRYRIFLQRGIGVPMEKQLKGTYVKVKFNKHISKVLDDAVYNGIAHHVSLVYGDYIDVFKILAKIKNWEVIL